MAKGELKEKKIILTLNTLTFYVHFGGFTTFRFLLASTKFQGDNISATTWDFAVWFFRAQRKRSCPENLAGSLFRHILSLIFMVAVPPRREWLSRATFCSTLSFYLSPGFHEPAVIPRAQSVSRSCFCENLLEKRQDLLWAIALIYIFYNGLNSDRVVGMSASKVPRFVSRLGMSCVDFLDIFSGYSGFFSFFFSKTCMFGSLKKINYQSVQKWVWMVVPVCTGFTKNKKLYGIEIKSLTE